MTPEPTNARTATTVGAEGDTPPVGGSVFAESPGLTELVTEGLASVPGLAVALGPVGATPPLPGGMVRVPNSFWSKPPLRDSSKFRQLSYSYLVTFLPTVGSLGYL